MNEFFSLLTEIKFFFVSTRKINTKIKLKLQMKKNNYVQYSSSKHNILKYVKHSNNLVKNNRKNSICLCQCKQCVNKCIVEKIFSYIYYMNMSSKMLVILQLKMIYFNYISTIFLFFFYYIFSKSQSFLLGCS